MKTALLSAFVLLGCCSISWADTFVSIDENGLGFINTTRITGAFAPDSGPEGLGSVLTYTLPFSTVVGDVFVGGTEPGLGTVVFDLVRFNGTTVLFYSDDVPTADSL